MRHITINNADVPFNLTYSIFKYGVTIVPKGKNDIDLAISSAEMVEKIALKAINKGYKKEGSAKELSHDDLIELMDSDVAAFGLLKDAVTEDMAQFTKSSDDSTEGEEGKK